VRTLVLLAMLLALPAAAADRFITVASTTSTQNSGLLDAILPVFTQTTGIDVRVVAVGTGQALRIARNGDADVLLVHHRASEDAFVAEGYGLARRDVMYNDFVLVGPASDPAGLRGLEVDAALRRLAGAGVPFLSRGDDSGTHKKEQELWRDAGLDPGGDWYRETGAGMGTTLNIAVAMGGYVLTDRGTWITFGNMQDHRILVSGDARLFNPYGVIVVNPERFAHVKAEDAQVFADWLVSDAGQAQIAGFAIAGDFAFCPNSDAMARDRAEKGETCPVDENSAER